MSSEKVESRAEHRAHDENICAAVFVPPGSHLDRQSVVMFPRCVNSRARTFEPLILKQPPRAYFRCARLATVNSRPPQARPADRKSTRLNSSHLVISYAVFCLKKKKKN